MIRLTTVFTLMLLAGAGLSSCSASRKTSATATATTTTTKTPEIVKAPESGPVSKHQMLIGKNASASAAQ